MNKMPKVVLPGQYITPEYQHKSDSEVERYFPGKGTTISGITVGEDGAHQMAVIVATVLGKVSISEVREQEDDGDGDKTGEDGKIKVLKKIVTVSTAGGVYEQYQKELKEENFDPRQTIAINLPHEGDVVLARITRINYKQAFCEILSVEGHGNVLSDSGFGANGEAAHCSLPTAGGSQSLSSYTAVASQSSQVNSVANDVGETFKGIIRSQDVRQTERDKIRIIECFRPGDIVRAEIISLGDGSNYYLSTAKNDLGVIYAKSEGGAGYLMYAIDWQNMICPQTGVVEKRKCANVFTN